MVITRETLHILMILLQELLEFWIVQHLVILPGMAIILILGLLSAPWRIYNIGNNSPVDLLDYIGALEDALGLKADKEMLPLQPGDVPYTYADVDDLVKDLNYKPNMDVKEGVKNFVNWYREYYKL